MMRSNNSISFLILNLVCPGMRIFYLKLHYLFETQYRYVKTCLKQLKCICIPSKFIVSNIIWLNLCVENFIGLTHEFLIEIDFSNIEMNKSILCQMNRFIYLFVFILIDPN